MLLNRDKFFRDFKTNTKELAAGNANPYFIKRMLFYCNNLGIYSNTLKNDIVIRTRFVRIAVNIIDLNTCIT